MTQEANKKLIEKKQDQSQETAKAINKFKTFLSNLGDDEKTLNKLFASATESKNEEIRCLCFLKLLESPHFKWKPEILELIPQNPGDLRVNTITAIQKSVSSLGDDEETLNKLFKFAKNAKDGYVRGICFVKILNSTHNHVNSIFPLIESLEDPHEKLRALLALAKNTEKISTDILEFVLNNLNLKSFKAEKKHQDFLKNILYYLALNINVSTQMLQRLYNKTVEFKLTREWI